MSKRVALATLGCKVNQYETQVLRENFQRANFKLVNFSEKADIYVINSCSITKRADEKSIDLIRQALKKNTGASVVVTGCLVEAEAEMIKDRFPRVTLIGNSEKLKIDELLAFLDSKHLTGFASKGKTVSSIQGFYSHDRAFIKVEDGCNQFCTYCRIPFVRGSKIRSRIPQEILAEIQLLLDGGFKEIVLVGVNLGLYGRDLTPPLALDNLLEIILTLKGNFRVRLSSLEPNLIPQELPNLMRDPRICPHLHLPLQSGDDEVLKRMRRRYTTGQYLKLIENLRKKVPYLGITTDVLVGFPGEEAHHFLNTYNFIKEIEFSRLHIFRFSPRKETPAFLMTPQVEGKIKKERSKRLRELGGDLSLRFISQFIGERLPVLIEGKRESKTQLLTGYTHNYIKVFLSGKKELRGEIKGVRLVKAGPGYALGQL